jgi:hypothetical protein
MADEPTSRPSVADADLEREVLEGRKFTLEEAIARMAGPGAIKGESPIARLEQARFEIEAWLAANLVDASGALRIALNRYVQHSELLLNDFERPLEATASCCRRLLESDYLLKELVRNADAEWGRRMGERPHFERDGGPAHPGDPYTISSVRAALQQLLKKLPFDQR